MCVCVCVCHEAVFIPPNAWRGVRAAVDLSPQSLSLWPPALLAPLSAPDAQHHKTCYC